MKNATKVMTALREAFPGHRVENKVIEANYNLESIFIDGVCVGHFFEDFFKKDLDNPEIEITITAPLNNIKNFVNFADDYGVIRGAIERGLQEWEEESQQNS